MAVHTLHRGSRRYFLNETAALSYDGTTETNVWATRVTANGGIAPTSANKDAVAAFVAGCKADGLWSDMLWCMIFCPTPTNVTCALTPLIVGSGRDPVTTNISLDGQANDLKGLHGDPGNNVSGLTNIQPTLLWANDSTAGVSLIVPDQRGVPNPTGFEFGGFAQNNSDCMLLSSSFSGNSRGTIWRDAGTVSVTGKGIGYYAMNRTGAIDLRLYFGKTGTPVAQVGATDTSTAGNRWNNFELRIFSIASGNSTFDPSGSYLSFICAHNGWGVTQETLLFARANLLRTGFGGGTV